MGKKQKQKNKKEKGSGAISGEKKVTGEVGVVSCGDQNLSASSASSSALPDSNLLSVKTVEQNPAIKDIIRFTEGGKRDALVEVERKCEDVGPVSEAMSQAMILLSMTEAMSEVFSDEVAQTSNCGVSERSMGDLMKPLELILDMESKAPAISYEADYFKYNAELDVESAFKLG